MALAEGFFGTATNGIGQGLAYVAPQTRSEDYAMQLAMADSQRLAAQSQARLKRQQELEDQFRDQWLKQKAPEFWSPFDEKIRSNEEAWKKDAAQYYSSTGRSPFNNPDFISRWNRDVIDPASKSNELAKEYASRQAAIQANPDRFSQGSIKELNDWYSKVQQDPNFALKPEGQIPNLKQKEVTANDFDQEVKPVAIKNNDGTWDTTRPNTAAHKDQVYEVAMGNLEKWAPVLQKYGFNPNAPDFPVYVNGRRVWYTNDRFIDKTATDIINSPQKDQVLTSLGIDPANAFADEQLKEVIRKQNSAMGKFVTERASAADAKVTQDTTRSYAGDANARANEGISLERARFNRGDDSKDEEKPLYITDLTNRIIDEEPGSGEALYDDIRSSLENDGKRIDGRIEYKGLVGGKRQIIIPAVYGKDEEDEEKVIYPRTVFTYDPKDRASAARKIIDIKNRYSTEKIPYSAVFSPKGDKKIPGGISAGELRNNNREQKPEQASGKTASLSQIRQLINSGKANGYTEKELIDYYKSQGYTIK